MYYGTVYIQIKYEIKSFFHHSKDMVPLHKWNCRRIMHIGQAQTEIGWK